MNEKDYWEEEPLAPGPVEMPLPDPVSEEIPAEEPLLAIPIPEFEFEDPETQALLAEVDALTAQLTPEQEAAPLEDLPPEEAPPEVPQPEVAMPQEAPTQVPSPSTERKPPRRERPVRKGRPKKPKGSGLFSIPQMLATVIWLLIILAIGVSLGRVIWVCAADVLAFGRESKEVTVSITSEDTMETIADKLYQAGLVRYPKLFLLYADLTDVEEEGKITTGTFTLNTIYDYHALVNMMSPRSGSRVVVENVLIPEGYNCRQIFQRLEEKGVCKVADLEAWAATGELGDYWFLENVERGSKYCLEGYLFPATYDFYENSTPKQVLVKMLDAFEANFTQELYAGLDALNEHISQMMRNDGRSEEYISANQLDLHGLITVASLIEKETGDPEESAMVASVIYNRLYSWGDTPRYLNIDASVIYALDGKSDLTAEDMAVDSPYNTYTNTGLTPGPITNPGLASLKAALSPADSGYYYYVLDPSTGSHEFSKTYEEHLLLIEKFKEASVNE